MTSPTLLWFRRDLRLGDHAALTAACKAGPVIPVFIRDGEVDALGTAPQWRLGLGLDHLARELEGQGGRLILRKGPALETLRNLISTTGAERVFWTRLYDAPSVARDSEIKAALKSDGIEARSFGGHLMFEPWTVETGKGEYYKVYTPFWRAVKDRDVEAPRSTPGKIPAPEGWPDSDRLEDWHLGSKMRRGAEVVRPFVQLGETAARDRLDHFIDEIVAGYAESRDRPDKDGTSRLSQNLALGEISPHQCWHAGQRALHDGKRGAETFLKELVWREFAYHLMHHTPRITHANWREDWDAFPWNEDERLKEVIAGSARAQGFASSTRPCARCT
jgi:deoxyribodipyrimidine photo-lyase